MIALQWIACVACVAMGALMFVAADRPNTVAECSIHNNHRKLGVIISIIALIAGVALLVIGVGIRP